MLSAHNALDGLDAYLDRVAESASEGAKVDSVHLGRGETLKGGNISSQPKRIACSKTTADGFDEILKFDFARGVVFKRHDTKK
mgnify:FL=1